MLSLARRAPNLGDQEVSPSNPFHNVGGDGFGWQISHSRVLLLNTYPMHMALHHGNHGIGDEGLRVLRY